MQPTLVGRAVPDVAFISWLGWSGRKCVGKPFSPCTPNPFSAWASEGRLEKLQKEKRVWCRKMRGWRVRRLLSYKFVFSGVGHENCVREGECVVFLSVSIFHGVAYSIQSQLRDLTMSQIVWIKILFHFKKPRYILIKIWNLCGCFIKQNTLQYFSITRKKKITFLTYWELKGTSISRWYIFGFQPLILHPFRLCVILLSDFAMIACCCWQLWDQSLCESTGPVFHCHRCERLWTVLRLHSRLFGPARLHGRKSNP